MFSIIGPTISIFGSQGQICPLKSKLSEYNHVISSSSQGVPKCTKNCIVFKFYAPKFQNISQKRTQNMDSVTVDHIFKWPLCTYFFAEFRRKKSKNRRMIHGLEPETGDT